MHLTAPSEGGRAGGRLPAPPGPSAPPLPVFSGRAPAARPPPPSTTAAAAPPRAACWGCSLRADRRSRRRRRAAGRGRAGRGRAGRSALPPSPPGGPGRATPPRPAPPAPHCCPAPPPPPDWREEPRGPAPPPAYWLPPPVTSRARRDRASPRATPPRPREAPPPYYGTRPLALSGHAPFAKTGRPRRQAPPPPVATPLRKATPPSGHRPRAELRCVAARRGAGAAGAAPVGKRVGAARRCVAAAVCRDAGAGCGCGAGPPRVGHTRAAGRLGVVRPRPAAPCGLGAGQHDAARGAPLRVPITALTAPRSAPQCPIAPHGNASASRSCSVGARLPALCPRVPFLI